MRRRMKASGCPLIYQKIWVEVLKKAWTLTSITLLIPISQMMVEMQNTIATLPLEPIQNLM